MIGDILAGELGALAGLLLGVAWRWSPWQRKAREAHDEAERSAWAQMRRGLPD